MRIKLLRAFDDATVYINDNSPPSVVAFHENTDTKLLLHLLHLVNTQKTVSCLTLRFSGPGTTKTEQGLITCHVHQARDLIAM